jgi:hypothetical protein
MYRTEDITLTKTETVLGHWRVTITAGDETLFYTHPTDEQGVAELIEDLEHKLSFDMCDCRRFISELAGFEYHQNEVLIVGGGCGRER